MLVVKKKFSGWPADAGKYGGKHAGEPLPLQQVRARLIETFDEHKGWKQYYRTILFPAFEDFLKLHAVKQAKVIGKTGLLSRSIKIGSGGVGPGKQAFRVVIEGEAANYARIINWGGTIRPKKVKHLTVPFGDNIDNETGGKIIGMRQIGKGEGFTITPKQGSLEGRKIVFLKGDAVERHGFTAHAYPGKGIGSRIKPVFELVKSQVIKGNRWAYKAQEGAVEQFNTWATEKIKEFFYWRQ